MDELSKLAELCEKAIPRDRGLNQAITEATRSQFNYGFTSSLDAAERLVPDEFVWCAGTAVDDEGRYAWANVHNADPYDSGRIDFSTRATTPALALCAAALRARSLTPASDGEGA